MSDYHLQQLAAASASAGSPTSDEVQIATSEPKQPQPTASVHADPPPTMDGAPGAAPVPENTPAAILAETPSPAHGSVEASAVSQPAPQSILHQPIQPESQQVPHPVTQQQVAPPIPSQDTVNHSSHPEGQTEPLPPHANVTETAPTNAQSTHAMQGIHPAGTPASVGDSVNGGQPTHPITSEPTTQATYASASANAARSDQISQGGVPPQAPVAHTPVLPQVHIAPSHQPLNRVALSHAQHPNAPTTSHFPTPYAQQPAQQSHHVQQPHHVHPHHVQNPRETPPQTQPIQHAPLHHTRLHQGMPPPHVQTHHVPYHATAQNSVQATPHSAAIVPLPPIGEPHSLETKYHQKCNECNALRHELEMKNNEIRKLKQEFYKKPSSAVNIKNNNSLKSPLPAMAVDGEKIMIDVDIGPSSSRTRSYDQRWKARFQDLVKYKLQHGDCIVPKSFKDKGLHSWVRKQRILKKDFDLGLASDESMTQERVNALNSIGFAWVVGHQSNDAQWEQNFQDLVVFKSQFGHTRVPQSYEKSLHKWVLNQRCRRRLLEEKGEGKAKGMTWARVEKLDAIDFSWSGKK
mmetsp:Transcript_17495/g.25873  ORF Transcript_17495/g.25873 Transcript_17495/m.25873 type:complete len:576 (-) Transcript_17495:51-1778(-)